MVMQVTPVLLGELPGGTQSQVLWCSADGGIAFGWSNDSSGQLHAVTWNPVGSAPQSLGTSGGLLYGQAQTCGLDGSMSGGFLATLYMGTPVADNALIWSGTTPTDLGVPSGAFGGSIIHCTNAPTSETGWLWTGNTSGLPGGTFVAAIWESGAWTALPSPSGFAFGNNPLRMARGLTDTAVGSCIQSVTAADFPFMWQGAAATQLPLPSPSVAGIAGLITDNGTLAIGRVTDSSGNNYVAAWSLGGTPTAMILNSGSGGPATGAAPAYLTPSGGLILGNAYPSPGVTGAAYWTSTAATPGFYPGLSDASIATVFHVPQAVGSHPSAFSGIIASDDGKIVTGYSDDGTNAYPIVWSSAVTTYQLMLLPGVSYDVGDEDLIGIVFMSNDGSTVFGSVSDSTGADRAVYWTLGAMPPPEPVPPTGACDSPTATSVTFTWTPDPDNPDPNTYTLRYGPHGSNPSTWTVVTGITGTSYTITVTANTSWDWQIEAIYDGTPTGFSTTYTCATTVTVPFATQFLSCGNGFTITAPLTKMWGFDHLIGMSVVGLLDGILMPAQVVAVDGSVTLPFAASNVKIGLPFTPQLQTPYLDAGQPTVQGRRKNISAVTARIEASLGVLAGANQPDGAAQQPPAIATTWGPLTPAQVQPVPSAVPVSPTYQSPAGQTVTKLVTGDMRTVVTADWQIPGQVAIQGTPGLPLNVLDCVPELLEGDTTEQTYAQREPREPRGGPGQPPARGPGLWMLRR